MQKIIHSRVFPWITGIVVFTVSVFISNTLIDLDAKTHENELHSAIKSQVDRMSTHLQHELNNNLLILDALESILLLNNDIGLREFEILTTRFLASRASIRQVQLSPDAVVSQIYPAIDTSIIGLDLRSIPGQKEIVERSIKDKKLYLAGPLELIQGGSAFIARKPLYNREGLETRFWGFITVIIDTEIFFNEVKMVQHDAHASYKIFAEDKSKNQERLIFGHNDDNHSYDLQESVEVPGGRWIVTATSHPDIHAHGVPLSLLKLWGILASSAFAFLSACTSTLLSKIYKRSITDPLTSLFNRQFFQSRAEDELDRAHRYKQPLCLMMIDLDHFKQINDQHGHQCGDMILLETAELIQNNLRENDLLGRYGGEEFIVLLPHSNLDQAKLCAERMCAALDTEVLVFGHNVSVSASIGIAELSKNQTYDNLINCADEALYKAKSAGRNRYKTYYKDEATVQPT